MDVNLHSDCTFIETNPSLYLLLNHPNSYNQFSSQIYIMIFVQQIFLLLLIILDGLLSELIIFYFAGNLPRKCASNEPQSNYFPLKILNTWHSEIFWYNILLTSLFCVLIFEIFYYICFGQKSLCLHIGILVLIWPVLHFLDN